MSNEESESTIAFDKFNVGDNFRTDFGEYTGFRDFTGGCESVRCVHLDQKRNYMICTFDSAQICVWNFVTAELLKDLRVMTCEIRSYIMDICEWDDDTLILGDNDANFYTYNIPKFEVRFFLATDKSYSTRKMFRISPDEFITVIGNAGKGELVVVSVSEKKIVRNLLEQVIIRPDTASTIRKCHTYKNCVVMNAGGGFGRDDLLVVNYEKNEIVKKLNGKEHSVFEMNSSSWIYHMNTFRSLEKEEIAIVFTMHHIYRINIGDSGCQKIVDDDNVRIPKSRTTRPQNTIILNGLCFVQSIPAIKLYDLNTSRNLDVVDDTLYTIFPLGDNTDISLRLVAKKRNSVTLACGSRNGKLIVFEYRSNHFVFDEDGEGGIELEDLKTRIDYMLNERESFVENGDDYSITFHGLEISGIPKILLLQ